MTGVMTMLPRSAFLSLAGVAASLNDGHVGVDGWKDRTAHLDGGGGEFPLRAPIDEDDALVVEADLSDEGGVKPGSVITAVDGHPARAIVARAIGLQGGQTASLRRAFARVLDAIYLVCGPHAAGRAYAVELTDPDGTMRRRTLAAVPAKVRTERYRAKAPASAAYVDRGMIGTAAVCEYNACEDAPKFRQFLAGFVAKARDAKARALIVDIRKNSGGDSTVNDELFAYVTSKPYRQFGGTRLRVSDRLKREYGREKYTRYYGDDAWRGKDGQLIEYAGDPPKPPRDEPNRFAGPAFLLSGAGTFSSAMACASAAKAYGLMRLAGEETGEPVYSTGEIYRVALQRTGFGVYVTTKVFLPPEPVARDTGVVPDVIVRTTRADRTSGRDPVLETALRLAAG